MNEPVNTTAEPPMPSRAPTDWRDPGQRRGYGTDMHAAAERGRTNPNTWQLVGYTSNREARYEWPNHVCNGRVATLGGLTEWWNADVVEFGQEDGTVLWAKWVAYLGPREATS